MKNIKGILLGVLLFGVLAGGIIFWQANQTVEDQANVTAEADYPMAELFELDEEIINAITDRNIAVTGIIWSNEGDDLERTITLGVNELNSIICQIDNRHLGSMAKLSKGQFVKIQGTVTGHDFDDMLGKTIQLKNCAMGKFN